MRGTSVWRTLFVANELNELSTERVLKVEYLLMILSFFLVGLEWEDFSKETPNMDTGIVNVEKNYILKFFLASFLFFAVGIVILVFRQFIELKFPLKIKEFIDLCSVANISLFILDHDLHGYYLHGKIEETAEGNAHHIQKAIRAEAARK